MQPSELATDGPCAIEAGRHRVSQCADQPVLRQTSPVDRSAAGRGPGNTGSPMEVRMTNSAWSVPLGVTLCVLLSGSAAAQETAGSTLQADSTVVFSESAEVATPGLKSGTTAFLLSFLGTAVPVVAGALALDTESSDSPVAGIMVVGGFVIGPSLGHFYANRSGPALAGIGIRVVALAVVAVSVLEEDFESPENSSVGLATGGVLLGAASLAWDILRSPHSASVHNDQTRQGRMTIGITPTIGAGGPGLRAAATF